MAEGRGKRLSDRGRKLAADHAHLAMQFARRYGRGRWDRGVVHSSAQLALVHAASAWDPAGPASFAAYAMIAMKREWLRGFRAELDPIRVPPHQFRRKGRDAAAGAVAFERIPLYDVHEARRSPDRTERDRAVWEAVEALPEVQREIVNRVWIRGDRAADVVRSMGLSEAEGRSLAKKAKRALRAALRPVAGLPPRDDTANRRKALAGVRSGSLTAVREVPGLVLRKSVAWECRCDCGATCRKASTDVRTGLARYCSLRCPILRAKPAERILNHA